MAPTLCLARLAAVRATARIALLLGCFATRIRLAAVLVLLHGFGLRLRREEDEVRVRELLPGRQRVDERDEQEVRVVPF